MEEKNILFNNLNIPVSLEPSVIRVYGAALIFATNSSMKCGARASLTIQDVSVPAHLYSCAVLQSLKHSLRAGSRWSAKGSGTLCCTKVVVTLTSARLVCGGETNQNTT